LPLAHPHPELSGFAAAQQNLDSSTLSLRERGNRGKSSLPGLYLVPLSLRERVDRSWVDERSESNPTYRGEGALGAKYF